MYYTTKTEITFLHTVNVADHQICLGKIEDERDHSLFFCATWNYVDDEEPPSNLTLSYSSKEIADAYTALVAEKTRHITDHVLKRDEDGVRVALYCEEDVSSLDEVDDVHDKVFVLSPSQLLSDYETGADQLMYCIKEPTNGKRGEFIRLLTNETTDPLKDDIIGVLRAEDVPEWAQVPFASLRIRYMKREVEW